MNPSHWVKRAIDEWAALAGITTGRWLVCKQRFQNAFIMPSGWIQEFVNDCYFPARGRGLRYRKPMKKALSMYLELASLDDASGSPQVL